MLCVVCKIGQSEIVRLLLDAFGELGYEWICVGDAELLHTAVYHHHVDVVRLLIERGALVDALSKPNRETALFVGGSGVQRACGGIVSGRGGFACQGSAEDATHMSRSRIRN